MEVEQRKVDQAVIVRVSGEVDMKTSPELRRHLVALVGEKSKWIIANLENVAYIDSSGLATLVECLQGVKKYGGRLSLTGMNDNIKDIFVMTRLDTIFEVFDTEEKALGSGTA
ncbi:MAG: STAS domain-containing protein [Planctomycetota bacterium]